MKFTRKIVATILISMMAVTAASCSTTGAGKSSKQSETTVETTVGTTTIETATS